MSNNLLLVTLANSNYGILDVALRQKILDLASDTRLATVYIGKADVEYIPKGKKLKPVPSGEPPARGEIYGVDSLDGYFDMELMFNSAVFAGGYFRDCLRETGTAFLRRTIEIEGFPQVMLTFPSRGIYDFQIGERDPVNLEERLASATIADVFRNYLAHARRKYPNYALTVQENGKTMLQHGSARNSKRITLNIDRS